jgi:hypothetical protein
MHLLTERLYFGGDHRDCLKDGVKTYLMAPMSPLKSPTIFSIFKSYIVNDCNALLKRCVYLNVTITVFKKVVISLRHLFNFLTIFVSLLFTFCEHCCACWTWVTADEKCESKRFTSPAHTHSFPSHSGNCFPAGIEAVGVSPRPFKMKYWVWTYNTGNVTSNFFSTLMYHVSI